MVKNLEETRVTETPSPEEIVTIIIDPKMTDGGIIINGRRYVGKVKVPQSQADDLLRVQSEYFATKQKLNDPSIKLRNQNVDVSKKFFMADPLQFASNPRFSKVYGMLDPFQWDFISEKDKEDWKQEREGLYNY